jgi:hypothetical protein
VVVCNTLFGAEKCATPAEDFCGKAHFFEQPTRLASLWLLGLMQVLRDEADCLLGDVGVATAAC